MQQRGLVANHLHDARMRVAQRVDADAGDEIQVTLALGVLHIASLAARQRQRITGIILEQIFALEFDDGLCGLVHRGR